MRRFGVHETTEAFDVSDVRFHRERIEVFKFVHITIIISPENPLNSQSYSRAPSGLGSVFGSLQSDAIGS